MKKIFCVFCGKDNSMSDDKCVSCDGLLNPDEHLWKDYLFSHVKDDLKDKVTDKTFSLIINFVKSHLYGVIMSGLIVATLGAGVVKSVNSAPIRNVSEKPKVIETQDLDLSSDTVSELYKINTFNNDLILGDEGFYQDKYVDYNSLSDESKLYMTMRLKKVSTSPYNFTNCEGLKNYENAYNMCINDTDGTWFGPGYVEYMYLMKIDINSFEREYKDLWGEDKELPKVKFDLKYSRECEYNSQDNDYLCHALMQGWPGEQYEITKLIKAEQLGNTIVIYDYYVFSNYDGTYKDRYGKDKISDIDYREIYFDDKEDMSILGQGQIYKHIYKKNSNGTYHFVSSEPISSIN